MRKALSLVEVLVAILLITVVIGAIIKMKNNNLFFIEKLKNSSLQNSYISLATTNTKEDKNIYLDKVFKISDDNIRKELKNVKVKLKVTDDNYVDVPENDYIKRVKVIESKYTIEDKYSSTYYEFELQYN